MIRVAAISRQFGALPSEIVGISDCYEAFCFNEACLYVISEISEGKEIFMDRQKSELIGFLKGWREGSE